MLDGIRRLFGGRPAPAAIIDAHAVVAMPPSREVTARMEGALSTIERIGESSVRQQSLLESLRDGLDGLPKLAESIGDLRRQATTLNETLAEHADRSRRSDDAEQSLMQRVGEGILGHAESMAQVQTQVDSLARTLGGLGEDLDRLRGSLSEIALHGARSTDALLSIADSQARRETELLAQIAGWKRWTIVIAVVVAMSALVTATGVVMLVLRGPG